MQCSVDLPTLFCSHYSGKVGCRGSRQKGIVSELGTEDAHDQGSSHRPVSTCRHRLPSEDGHCGQCTGGSTAVGHCWAGEVRCCTPRSLARAPKEGVYLTLALPWQVSLCHSAVLQKGRRRGCYVRPHSQAIFPVHPAVAEQRGGEQSPSWKVLGLPDFSLLPDSPLWPSAYSQLYPSPACPSWTLLPFWLWCLTSPNLICPSFSITQLNHALCQLPICMCPITKNIKGQNISRFRSF